MKYLPMPTANLGPVYMLCGENKFLQHIKCGIQGSLVARVELHTICILISVVLLFVLKKHIHAVPLGTQVTYPKRWGNPARVTILLTAYSIAGERCLLWFWALDSVCKIKIRGTLFVPFSDFWVSKYVLIYLYRFCVPCGVISCTILIHW